MTINSGGDKDMDEENEYGFEEDSDEESSESSDSNGESVGEDGEDWETDESSESSESGEDAVKPKANSTTPSTSNNTTQQTVFYDSSDGEGLEQCAICLSHIRQQDIGTPESCDHIFCLECIMEWSKNVNTCPQDRLVFKLILARHSLDGPVFKSFVVKDKDADDEQEEEAEDDVHCEVCGNSDREDRLLLCDGCDHGYHCECLEPPLRNVPVGSWFCHTCRPSTAAEEQVDSEEEYAQMGRSNHGRRIIPRTLVSERVRAAIAETRSRGRRIIYSESEESGQDQVNSLTIKSVPQKRKASQKSKPKRKVKRRRKTTKQGVNKKKTKKRRKKKCSRKTQQRCRTKRDTPKSSTNRIMDKVKTLSSSRVNSAASRLLRTQTLSIFGDPLSINSYEDASEDEFDIDGGNTLVARARTSTISRASLKSHMIIRTPVTRRDAIESRIFTPPVENNVPDLLGSILSAQENLITKVAKIGKDGKGTLVYDSKKSDALSKSNLNKKNDSLKPDNKKIYPLTNRSSGYAKSFASKSPSHKGGNFSASNSSNNQNVINNPTEVTSANNNADRSVNDLPPSTSDVSNDNNDDYNAEGELDYYSDVGSSYSAPDENSDVESASVGFLREDDPEMQPDLVIDEQSENNDKSPQNNQEEKKDDDNDDNDEEMPLESEKKNIEKNDASTDDMLIDDISPVDEEDTNNTENIDNTTELNEGVENIKLSENDTTSDSNVIPEAMEEAHGSNTNVAEINESEVDKDIIETCKSTGESVPNSDNNSVTKKPKLLTNPFKFAMKSLNIQPKGLNAKENEKKKIVINLKETKLDVSDSPAINETVVGNVTTQSDPNLSLDNDEEVSQNIDMSTEASKKPDPIQEPIQRKDEVITNKQILKIKTSDNFESDDIGSDLEDTFFFTDTPIVQKPEKNSVAPEVTKVVSPELKESNDSNSEKLENKSQNIVEDLESIPIPIISYYSDSNDSHSSKKNDSRKDEPYDPFNDSEESEGETNKDQETQANKDTKKDDSSIAKEGEIYDPFSVDMSSEDENEQDSSKKIRKSLESTLETSDHSDEDAVKNRKKDDAIDMSEIPLPPSLNLNAIPLPPVGMSELTSDEALSIPIPVPNSVNEDIPLPPMPPISILGSNVMCPILPKALASIAKAADEMGDRTPLRDEIDEEYTAVPTSEKEVIAEPSSATNIIAPIIATEIIPTEVDDLEKTAEASESSSSSSSSGSESDDSDIDDIQTIAEPEDIRTIADPDDMGTIADAELDDLDRISIHSNDPEPPVEVIDLTKVIVITPMGDEHVVEAVDHDEALEQCGLLVDGINVIDEDAGQQFEEGEASGEDVESDESGSDVQIVKVDAAGRRRLIQANRNDRNVDVSFSHVDEVHVDAIHQSVHSIATRNRDPNIRSREDVRGRDLNKERFIEIEDDRHKHKRKHKEKDRHREVGKSRDTSAERNLRHKRKKKSRSKSKERRRVRRSRSHSLDKTRKRSKSKDRKRKPTDLTHDKRNRRQSRSISPEIRREKDRELERREREKDRVRQRENEWAEREREKERERIRQRERELERDREQRELEREREKKEQVARERFERERQEREHERERERERERMPTRRGHDQYKGAAKMFSQSIRGFGAAEEASNRRYKLKRNVINEDDDSKKGKFVDVEILNPVITRHNITRTVEKRRKEQTPPSPSSSSSSSSGPDSPIHIDPPASPPLQIRSEPITVRSEKKSALKNGSIAKSWKPLALQDEEAHEKDPVVLYSPPQQEEIDDSSGSEAMEIATPSPEPPPALEKSTLEKAMQERPIPERTVHIENNDVINIADKTPPPLVVDDDSGNESSSSDDSSSSESDSDMEVSDGGAKVLTNGKKVESYDPSQPTEDGPQSPDINANEPQAIRTEIIISSPNQIEDEKMSPPASPSESNMPPDSPKSVRTTKSMRSMKSMRSVKSSKSVRLPAGPPPSLPPVPAQKIVTNLNSTYEPAMPMNTSGGWEIVPPQVANGAIDDFIESPPDSPEEAPRVKSTVHAMGPLPVTSSSKLDTSPDAKPIKSQLNTSSVKPATPSVQKTHSSPAVSKMTAILETTPVRIPPKALQEMENLSKLLNAQSRNNLSATRSVSNTVGTTTQTTSLKASKENRESDIQIQPKPKLVSTGIQTKPVKQPLAPKNMNKQNIIKKPVRTTKLIKSLKKTRQDIPLPDVMDLQCLSPVSDDELIASFSPPPVELKENKMVNGTDDRLLSEKTMDKQEKYLEKTNRQHRVIEEVKVCLKPHYSARRINKTEYKEIMRKSVPKITHNKKGEINPLRIHQLIEAYVVKAVKLRKYKARRKKETEENREKVEITAM